MSLLRHFSYKLISFSNPYTHSPPNTEARTVPGLQVREGMGAEGNSLKLSANTAVIWLITVNASHQRRSVAESAGCDCYTFSWLSFGLRYFSICSIAEIRSFLYSSGSSLKSSYIISRALLSIFVMASFLASEVSGFMSSM